MLNQYKIIIAILAFVFSFSLTAEAQDSAGAITTRASSQLVLWYDEDAGRESFLQITNTSPTTPVEVHIQIYTSDDLTRCVEADFNDVYTMNDTHVYELDNILLNQGEAGTPAPVPSVDGTKGFVVITPVVGAGDNTAISFQNLLGTIYIDRDVGSAFNIAAAGRDAVDLTNGIIVPDGTPLDGVSTGYLQIRPDELTFNVTDADVGLSIYDEIDVVSFVFNDQFGPAGLLGYRAVPGESTFSPFLFDFQEVPGSCPIITNTCFNNWGVNAQFPADNQLTDPGVNVCDAVTLGAQNDGIISGWMRLFVNSISASGNQFAVIRHTSGTFTSAEWSHVVGPPIPIGPPVECQNLPAECGNPVCKPLPGCENPDASMGGSNFCADGIDNDGVNGTDCQDFGCDGFVAPSGMGPTGPCESAGETSCSDDFDNDLNGFIDCGGIEVVGETTQVAEPDPNCVAIGACGAVDTTTTTSGSGGCSLAAAGSETTGTTAANYLLALLPLAGVFALRRIRRRSSK